MRRTSFCGSPKALSGSAETVSFTNSELNSERVIGYHVILEGTATGGNTLADITRIRLSANGSNIINVTPTQLRAWWQSYTGGRVLLPTTAKSFTIPLFMPDAPTEDQQDISQFPSRSQVQLDIELTASEAGNMMVGWTETTIAAQVFPRILSSAMNINASSGSGRYVFQENGIVRGLLLPNAGLNRLRIAIGGTEYIHMPAAEFNSFGSGEAGNMSHEAEVLYNNGPSQAGTTLDTTLFHRLTGVVPAPIEGSYIELVTEAGWSGAALETVLYSVSPNGPAVPQAA